MKSQTCWTGKVCVASGIGMLLVNLSWAQKVDYYPHGVTNVPSSDYSVGTGNTERLPKNYDYYYYNNRYAPPVTVTPVPVASPTPFQHIVLGYVKPYSSLEYSNLIISRMNDEREREGLSPIGSDLTSGTAAVQPPETGDNPATSSQEMTNDSAPRLEAAHVVNVAERGVIETADAGEIRLRGVAFVSTKTNYATRKEFAEQSLNALRELLVGKTIYYVVEDPPKGLDGRTLAIVHLQDGTQLNRLALESGLGVLSPGDFPEGPVTDDLVSAQAEAVVQHRGLWDPAFQKSLEFKNHGN